MLIPRLTLPLIALCGLVAQAPVGAQQAPPPLTSFLEQSAGFNEKQFAALERGQSVAKVLKTTIDRDVAVVSVITVDVPRAWFVEHLTAVDRPLRSPTRSLSGVFSTPAVPGDIGDLALSKNDVKDLKACHPRSCNFKLPAAGMAYLSTNADWNSPNISTELLHYAREQMAAYVNDYRLHGSAAMVVYDDQPTVKSSDALAGLLSASPYLYPSVPAFQKYLLDYPNEKLDSVTNMIFWSQDQMPHTRPLLNIRQLSIFSPPDPGNVTLIANKQLWADHYLEASLDILGVIDRSTVAGHESVYLVALRQFRFDNLPNNRLFSIRNRVAGGLRDQAESDLQRIKQTYEQDFRPSDTRKPH